MSDSESSQWVDAFENVGCGFMALLFIVWFIGLAVTNNPLWFKG